MVSCIILLFSHGEWNSVFLSKAELSFKLFLRCENWSHLVLFQQYPFFISGSIDAWDDEIGVPVTFSTQIKTYFLREDQDISSEETYLLTHLLDIP